MSPMAPVLALILFLALVWFVISPLFTPQLEPLVEDDDRESLQIRKRALYRQIKELEMDYEIGNLSPEDFQQARQDLKNEVAAIMTKLKGIRQA
ncbi:MAG: c-type cytochrome biogenesis protein CcmI [FCB group bacterium]|nr:c-type cytochrome biogenesis protein CcmI [FCB group bacterium]